MPGMSKEQAAIADVVAKMRRFADRHWMHPACQVVREFADMIDSVLKRDCGAEENIEAFADDYRFCPGCGAKMEGGIYVK